MAIKIFFIILATTILSSCFLFEKSTKNFPNLKINYISKSYKFPRNLKNEIVKQKSLLISSNIDIENEAKNRGLTISSKDFFCLFDKSKLEDKDGYPNKFRTITGYVPDEDKKNKDNITLYNFSIWSTKNQYANTTPINSLEKIEEKNDEDTLYCQYAIYFYLAKPIVKSNIIEIPFKDIRGILEK